MGTMGKRTPALLAMLLLSAPAAAESVRMTGKFAAKSRDVAMLRSLSIEQFGGRDGPALSLALERILSQGAPPHFRLTFGGRRDDADGVVSGAVSTRVDLSDYRKTEKHCAERVDKKCVREEEQEIRCTRRTIELRADVRVADVAGGRIVFSNPLSRQDETSWCGGDRPADPESAVRGMIDSVAGEFATIFAPRVESYSVRFRESTKGLAKEQEKPFKEAVRLTKTDLPAACRAWTEIDMAAAYHPSVVFDLGLCAEAAGDYPAAEALYRRAAPLTGRGGEGEVGLGRIGDLLAARDDDAARVLRR